MQVAADPVAVLQHGQSLAVLAGPDDLQGQGGVLGEAGRQRRVQGVVLLGPLPAPRQGQGAVHLLAGPQRHHDRGPEAGPAEDPRDVEGPRVGGDVLDGDGVPVSTTTPASDRSSGSARIASGSASTPDVARSLSEARSWPVTIQATSAPATSRARSAIVCRASMPGSPAVSRAVISAVAASQRWRRDGLLVEPGVLDRDARRGRERDHDLLVRRR